MDLTPEEIKIEHAYLIDERLALLGVFGKPTPEQYKIAKDEADAWLATVSYQGEQTHMTLDG